MSNLIQTGKNITLHLIVACASNMLTNTVQATTVYENFTLIDPLHTSVTEDAYLVVDDDTITAIGQGEAPLPVNGESREYIDMSGTYALPGLFDSHAHITSGPLKVLIEDGKPVVDMSSQNEVTQHNALMALAFGITTVRNPASDPQASQHYSMQINTGKWPGPEALHAGFTFHPTPIRGGSVYPENEQEWLTEIKRQKSLGMDFIKLYTGLNKEELALGIRLAHEHEMKTIAHLDSVSWLTAIDLGIDALTHALPTSADLLKEEDQEEYLASRSPISSTFMYQWFEKVDFDSEPMQKLIKALSENAVVVDMTLQVNALTYFFDEAEEIFPSQHRQYFHPKLMTGWDRNMQASHYGWTAEDYQRAHAVFPKVLEFTRLLHDAGVPMLIGTDGYSGAMDLSKEMVWHKKAGLTSWEVLSLATHQSADILGIGDRTGALQPGLEADVVFLNSNPLTDMANTRDIHTTVVNGQAYSFEQLIDMGQALITP